MEIKQSTFMDAYYFFVFKNMMQNPFTLSHFYNLLPEETDMITLKISGVTEFGPRDENGAARGAGAPRCMRDGVIIAIGFLHQKSHRHR